MQRVAQAVPLHILQAPRLRGRARTNPAASHTVSFLGTARSSLPSTATMHTGVSLVDTPRALVSLALLTHVAEQGVHASEARQNCTGHGTPLHGSRESGLVAALHSAAATTVEEGWLTDGTDAHCTVRNL